MDTKRDALLMFTRNTVRAAVSRQVAHLNAQIDSRQLLGQPTEFLEQERAGWVEAARVIDLELKDLQS